MMKHVSRNFREKFELPFYFMDSTFSKWYPGHMAKGLRAVRAMIHQCDCVVEVHDARIAELGRNPNFYQFVARKPKILMLNKSDLVDRAKFKNYTDKLYGFGENIFISNCKRSKDPNVKRLLPKIRHMIEEGEIKGDVRKEGKTGSYRILVCGIPNTGKSSLINSLRRINMKRGDATPVGKLPGVTRALMNKILIHEDPKIYIYDTPGVIPPQIDDPEVGLKLAIVGCFPDHLIGEDLIADYLLYTLNKNNQFQYVQLYGLPGPCDDFDIVSMFIARKTGFWNGNKPEYKNTSVHFLRHFRKGELGKVFLEHTNDCKQ